MHKFLANIGLQTLKTITGKLKKGATRAGKKVPIRISARTFVLFVGVIAAASLVTSGNFTMYGGRGCRRRHSAQLRGATFRTRQANRGSWRAITIWAAVDPHGERASTLVKRRG